MDVISIKAGIKYSKDTGNGWKTVGVGAEANVDIEEDWVLAQQGLYSMLTAQLRTLWNTDGHNGHQKAGEGTWGELESLPSPVEEKPGPRAHWCQLHETEFRKFEKEGRYWYSHKDGNGWCKEQPKGVGR